MGALGTPLTEGAGATGRLSPAAVDRLLAGAVTVLHLLNPQLGSARPDQSWLLGTAGLLLTLGQGVPLLWRRGRPLTVLACIGASWLVAYLFVTGTAPFGLWVALYSLIVYAPRRTAEVASAAVVAGFCGLGIVRVSVGGSARLQGVVPLLIGTLMVVLVGFAVADRRGRTVALRERAAFLEREREALSRQAVAEERLRIARELHDLVAHSLSTIAIQSSTGRLALPEHPEVALEALEAIESSSRDATRELRHLLGVLREDEGPAAVLVPSPGLADLASLLAAVRAAGVEVRLRADGAARQLPHSVDLVAYRVVQEALTNAVKHAAPAGVDVGIRYDADELVIVVSDDGGAGPLEGGGGPGHGIVGMRERVAAIGGEFSAGPRLEGGFEVTARLPIAEESR
jgi:signal transduction histidine kinase